MKWLNIYITDVIDRSTRTHFIYEALYIYIVSHLVLKYLIRILFSKHISIQVHRKKLFIILFIT